MMVSWQTERDLRENERREEEFSTESEPEKIGEQNLGMSPTKSILKRGSLCPFKECFGRASKKVKIHCEHEQTDV